MSLADEKYLLLTTFRRNGTAVPTSIWAVPLAGGKIGFTTGSASGKVKRLAHTSRVTVQPCDSRGRARAGTTAVEATAEVVTGAAHAEIEAKVKAKYGFMNTLITVFNVVSSFVKRSRQSSGDCGVVITLAD